MSSNLEHVNHHVEQMPQQQLEETVFKKHAFSETEKDPSIYWHPTLSEYYHNLTPLIILSIFVATLLAILNIAIFGTTVSRLKKSMDAYYRGPSIVMCSLYPIICCAALTTILLPKTWLICHTVMHLSFTVGAVVFRQLCFRYVDSEVSYLKETNGVAANINTLPCCCCCLCLPRLRPSNTKFFFLRYMVWQMPFVQGSMMLVLNVIYLWDQDLYKSVNMYFIPFIVCSIFVGLWALNIIVRMVSAINSESMLMKKMLCLQLILVFCKLQYLLLDSQLDHIVLGGKYPINHTIYKQTLINILILCEMVFVSMLAQNAYKITK